MSRLTVLMPTYNVAPWVEEAIRSVLNQTYRDFELLVVDDASTDDTLDRVRAIDDPRIRIASLIDRYSSPSVGKKRIITAIDMAIPCGICIRLIAAINSLIFVVEMQYHTVIMVGANCMII